MHMWKEGGGGGGGGEVVEALKPLISVAEGDLHSILGSE